VAPAGTDIGRGARDRAGRGQAAEQRHGEVRRAWASNSALERCAPPINAVGDHRREQRLHPARKAMTSADGSNASNRRAETGGRCGQGSPAGNAP